MALAMKATVTTMSSYPCCRSRPTTCSIMGRLAMGSMGFGWFEVRGRRRVPSPPAMISAFTGASGENLPGHRAGHAHIPGSRRACSPALVLTALPAPGQGPAGHRDVGGGRDIGQDQGGDGTE